MGMCQERSSRGRRRSNCSRQCRLATNEPARLARQRYPIARLQPPQSPLYESKSAHQAKKPKLYSWRRSSPTNERTLVAIRKKPHHVHIQTKVSLK
jgi:hypothetical protein